MKTPFAMLAVLLCCCSCCVLACCRDAVPSRKPVVFVPGLGGSIIQARRSGNRRRVPADCRPSRRGWYRLWLNLYEMLGWPNCLTKDLSLEYGDSKTGIQADARDSLVSKARDSHVAKARDSSRLAATRVAYFGSMRGVNILDRSLLVQLSAGLSKNPAAYALPFTRLLAQLGYKYDEDLVAAPYDFRYSPEYHGQYFKDLKQLVEQTYRNNNKQRVVLVTHSYGGIMTHRFLVHHVTADWKRKYLECWVPVAVPWAGSVAALHSFSTGSTGLDIKFDRALYANMVRSWESTMTTLPTEGVVKGSPGESVIVSVGGRDYTSADTAEFVGRVAGPRTRLRYLRATKSSAKEGGASSLEHPGVDIRSAISSGMDTVNRIDFPEGTVDFLNSQANVTYGDGDGSVNAQSLRAIDNWSTHPGDYVYKVYDKPGVDHQDVLSSDFIAQIMLDINGVNDD